MTATVLATTSTVWGGVVIGGPVLWNDGPRERLANSGSPMGRARQERIAATVLGIFLIPMLYLLVRRNISRKQPHAAGHLEEPRSTSPASGSEGEAAR